MSREDELRKVISELAHTYNLMFRAAVAPIQAELIEIIQGKSKKDAPE